MDNDDIENIGTNTSGNRPFEDILSHHVSRRGVIGGGALGAASFFFGTAVTASKVSASGHEGTSLGFTAIPTDSNDDISLPEGYSAQAFAAWGEPINGISPRFMKDASNPAEHQERQIGQGHDGMTYFGLGANKDSNTRGMLCINHEYTLGALTFPDGFDNWDAVKTRKEQAGHGLSVIEVVRKGTGD